MYKKNVNLKVMMFTGMVLFLLSGCKQQGSDGKTVEDPAKQKRKAFRDLDYNDLKESKARLISQGKQEIALKHIEKMIPLCNDIHELKDLTLEMADLYFETGNFKGAERMYSQFGDLYPGDKNIEYATYKAILCNDWLSLEKQRDQSNTKKTIELAKGFLERSTIFKKYNDEVEKILVRNQNKILQSEISVLEDYINRGDQLSAKTRLANIEKEYITKMPHLEPKLLALACEYAKVFNDDNLRLAKEKELEEKFPAWTNETFTLACASPEVLNPAATAENKTNKKSSFLDKF